MPACDGQMGRNAIPNTACTIVAHCKNGTDNCKKLSLRDIVSEVYKTAEILLAMSQGAAPVHYFCCMSLHKRSH